MKKFDVAVIGAGVVGAMVAREMTRYTASVAIIEKESDVAMGASCANSAIVHAGFDAKSGTLKALLNVKGSKMMERVTSELGVKYKKNGSMVVAFTDEQMEMVKELKERGDENGVEGLEILSKEEVLEKESALSKDVKGALWAPTGAIICPYELTIAGIGNAMDNGAELFLESEVLGIEKDGDEWIVKTSSQTIIAKVVINCAGIHSDKIASMAGDTSFGVHARRGEYLLLDKTVGSTVKSTIFTPPTKLGKGILISPTVDGNLILGPTAEDIDDKEDKKTTARGLEKVLEAAKLELISVPRCVITSFTGLRAVGSTGDFIINEVEKGFINAAGIESPGLSASCAIAEYIRDIVKNTLELKERKEFNPTRPASHFFKNLTDEEKAEVIKKDATYGRIVCRCEEITEGEILSALRTNPRATTVDGVKRRTRATMGRCQGGFCLPYIIEIMAKEMSLSPEQITKNGKGSEYIPSKR